MLNDWDIKIQDAKRLLVKVEDRAIRLREAINTFEVEKSAAQSNPDATPAETATQC